MNCFTTNTKKAIPIIAVVTSEFRNWLKTENAVISNWVKTVNFTAAVGTICLINDAKGNLSKVLLGIKNAEDFWSFGALPKALPSGNYAITTSLDSHTLYNACLAWGLGCYQFTAYKQPTTIITAQLVLPKNVDKKTLDATINSIYLVRDLINTPTDDMGPEQLANVMVKVAKEHKAKIHQIVGEDLLKHNYPTIYAVGRACPRPPRLIDITWGNPKHPKVTLVGKGVCFDTGGLDIKPSSGMLTMKKDMAGAAHVIGLANIIMTLQLPIRLRVLVPAVENSIAGNAYHPGDVIKTRKGITVEVLNTDAEGRLILCDALTEAVSENPDLIVDYATLTGAARVALGPDVGALFTPHEFLAENLLAHAEKQQDPIWRLPIYANYRRYLESQIADIANCSLSGDGGGAITAAIYLKEFVPDNILWAHFDIMASNAQNFPGRPLGGEAQGLRAVLSYLQERYK